MKHTVSREHRTFAKLQRSEMTRAEAALWQVLRAGQLGGWKFKRQVPFGPYVADFSCAAGRLIVELDGRPHEETEQRARDATRDRWFQARGFRVLRLPNGLVLASIELAVQDIERALPSPVQGEGGPAVGPGREGKDYRTPSPGSLRSPPSPSREEG